MSVFGVGTSDVITTAALALPISKELTTVLQITPYRVRHQIDDSIDYFGTWLNTQFKLLLKTSHAILSKQSKISIGNNILAALALPKSQELTTVN